ncbi:hypothetical protein V502_00781 [Pseudogymnoascus sp. VKM F-4520 (FW-2644)]|nr:hypothetical protein V502_00781 [Pseudogymnoascus sp. VKM F-4520 (FW-2644)]
MTRILLTGGSGFIATHVLNVLLERGHSVVTTVRSQDKADKIRKAHSSFGKDKLRFRWYNLKSIMNSWTPGAQTTKRTPTRTLEKDRKNGRGYKAGSSKIAAMLIIQPSPPGHMRRACRASECLIANASPRGDSLIMADYRIALVSDHLKFEPMESGSTNATEDDNFLSLATQAGLASYVASKISGGDIPVGVTFGKPLLAYAVSLDRDGIPLLSFSRARNYAGVGYNLPDLRVIKALLSFGADPNERYQNTTVWKEAVETSLQNFVRNYGFCGMGMQAQNERRWIETMRIMLQHGAYPEMPCFTVDANPRSVREVIRETLEGRPEYAKDLDELEDIFNEKVSRSKWQRNSKLPFLPLKQLGNSER